MRCSSSDDSPDRDSWSTSSSNFLSVSLMAHSSSSCCSYSSWWFKCNLAASRACFSDSALTKSSSLFGICAILASTSVLPELLLFRDATELLSVSLRIWLNAAFANQLPMIAFNSLKLMWRVLNKFALYSSTSSEVNSSVYWLFPSRNLSYKGNHVFYVNNEWRLSMVAMIVIIGLIIIIAEMAVVNVAVNLKWGRHIWSVMYSFPTETNSK